MYNVTTSPITRNRLQAINHSPIITANRHTTSHHNPSHFVQGKLKTKSHSPGGSRPSQGSSTDTGQFMQALQDEAGTGLGSPGQVCGRHQPIAAMYFATRGALGAGSQSEIFSTSATRGALGAGSQSEIFSTSPPSRVISGSVRGCSNESTVS